MLQGFENKVLGAVEKINSRLTQPIIGLTRLLQESNPMKQIDRFNIIINTNRLLGQLSTNKVLSSILPFRDFTLSQKVIMDNTDFSKFLTWVSDNVHTGVKKLSTSDAGSYARWFISQVVKEQYRRINTKKPRDRDNILLMIAFNVFSFGSDLSSGLEMKHFDKKTKEKILRLIMEGAKSKELLIKEMDAFEKNTYFEPTT